jgi:hypothetical protein
MQCCVILFDDICLAEYENSAVEDIWNLETVIGGWGKFHRRDHHDLHSSPVIRMIRSWRMRWTEHVARMGRREMLTQFWLGKPEGWRQIGRLNVVPEYLRVGAKSHKYFRSCLMRSS